eukprot:scaffold80568_cov16-Prasinocladus_malaysianus.AAC.1
MQQKIDSATRRCSSDYQCYCNLHRHTAGPLSNPSMNEQVFKKHTGRGRQSFYVWLLKRITLTGKFAVSHV